MKQERIEAMIRKHYREIYRIGFSDDENVIVTKGWKKIPLNGGA